MNVLVIGSGAREHCLAHALSLSKKAEDIFLIPGNAGTAAFAKNLNIGIDEKSFPLIEEAIKRYGIEMTVVGPEAPLVAGIVDYLEKRGHRVFGPDKKASVIEASKRISALFRSHIFSYCHKSGWSCFRQRRYHR